MSFYLFIIFLSSNKMPFEGNKYDYISKRE